jgi:hypothetical protein
MADVPKESDLGVEKPVNAEEYVDRGKAYYADDDADVYKRKEIGLRQWGLLEICFKTFD